MIKAPGGASWRLAELLDGRLADGLAA
jgi:hypothetical protein